MQQAKIKMQPMTSDAGLQLRVHRVRDETVILDNELAALYGVSTKRFNQAFKRNRGRFPRDFVFQLTAEEHAGLRSQIVTSNVGRGGRRYSALDTFVLTAYLTDKPKKGIQLWPKT